MVQGATNNSMITDLILKDYIDYQVKIHQRQISPTLRYYLKDFANFINRKHNSSTSPVTQTLAPTQKLKVALMTEEIGSMTGGRYYAWLMGCALVEAGFDVTIYTTQEPTYKDFFTGYKQPKMQIVTPKLKMKALDVQADIYIGVPLIGNDRVIQLSKKYKKPGYVMVFDPHPTMIKHIGKPYGGWEELIPAIRGSDVSVLALCDYTASYLADWLHKREDQIHVVMPCINSIERDKVAAQKREDYVVYVSRLVDHKRFLDVFKAVKAVGTNLKIISSVGSETAMKHIKALNMQNKVEFLRMPSDLEKFKIISRARAVISASSFEGFGMYAAEAVSTGTPLVAYEFPTIQEIEKKSGAKNFYLAANGDIADLTKKLRQALTEKIYEADNHTFDFTAMVNRVRELFFQPVKIGVVMIALNEEMAIPYSLKALIRNEHIKKVAVIEGAVNLFSHAADTKGFSLDKTQDHILTIKKMVEGDKIVYDRYGWASDKSELRNRALQLLPKDITHVLVVDADEVWAQEDLNKLADHMNNNRAAGVFLFPFKHFWHNSKTLAVGSNWDSKLFRCFKYQDKSLHWAEHQKPVVNQALQSIEKEGVMVLEDLCVYHLGYVKPEKNVLDKLRYYSKRDVKLIVRDTFSRWKPGMPTSTTHGGGSAVAYAGIYPEEMQDMIEKGIIK